MKRILLSAYQCAPGAGSVSQIGWEWYSRLSQTMHVTLATHIRNRVALEAAGAPLPNTEIVYIDTEWLAGPLYGASKRIFRGSEHAVFLISSFDFFVYDAALVRHARKMMRDGAQWDLVHAVTPVSPSSFTRLSRLGLPVVRGPLNGGLRTPAQFPELMKADSSWLYSLRDLTRPIRQLLGRRCAGDVILTANDATRESLTRREKEVARGMMEIAVDPQRFSATPWPPAPSGEIPLRLVFVGRLIAAKALSLLLGAMIELKPEYPIELTVIGDGPMREAWERQAGELDGAVKFTGAQNAAAVAEAIEDSHALCLPSVRESGGAVLLEAMSCGRPVIGLALGGPGAIITPEVGQLAPAQSTRAAIDGLKAVLADIFAHPDAWRQRGLNVRIAAEKDHSWDARIRDFSLIFDELVTARAIGESQ